MLHFTTSAESVIDAARSGESTFQVGDWSTGYTAMADHTAALPAATNYSHNAAGQAFTYFPFFQTNTYHWGVGANESAYARTPWECDDYTGGYAYDTHHQIWVR